MSISKLTPVRKAVRSSRERGTRFLNRPRKKHVSIATRTYAGGNLSAVDAGNYTYTFRHQATNNGSRIKVVFGNFYQNGGDFDGPNPYTIKLSVKHNGVLYPVFFGGQRSITIQPGESVVESDEIVGLSFVEGDYFYTNTYVTVPAGGKYPLTMVTNASIGEGRTVGDITDGGAVTAYNNYGFAPFAIIGVIAGSRKPVIGLIGDSIMYGFSNNDLSFAELFCINNRIPYVKLAKSGERANQFTAEGRRHRWKYLDYGITHAIVEYATNDMSQNPATLSAVTTPLQEVWNALDSRGIKVAQTTCVPRTTSTDSWATLANQTPMNAAFSPAGTNVRGQFNTYVKTLPSPVYYAIDINVNIEGTGADAGKWAPGKTTDGIHPSGPSHGADMAPLIDIAKFVL